MAGVLFRAVAGLVFAKFAAASLGPARYATYGHFYMVATYLVTGASLGLGNAFSIYVARERRSNGEASDDGLLIVLISAVCGLVIGAIAVGLFFLDTKGVIMPRVRGWDIAWWFTFCFVSSVGTSIQSTMLGRQWHVRYQLTAILNPVLSCLALAGGMLFGRISPAFVILTYMLGFATPIVFYPAIVKGSQEISKVALEKLAKFSAPYLLPSMLIPTVGAFATLAVRHLIKVRVDEHDLGLWQGLWRLSEGYMGALISVGSALYIPRFSRVTTQRESISAILKASSVLLGLYFPLALSFLTIPQIVLALLLSSKFGGISSFLPAEIVGDTLKICYFILQLFLTCTLFPKLALIGEAIFSALFLFLTWLIESHYHTPEGAVVAYSASYLVVVCMFIPIVWRRIKLLPE
jgi:O-antigen/teichoic acid export membrane protein